MSQVSVAGRAMLIGLLAIGLTSISLAAPMPLTYQGQLKLNGVSVEGAADFKCSLWDRDTGGSRLMDFNAVTGASVVNGLFTVELQFSVEPSSVLDGGVRWLEIQVASPSGSEYVTLSPRQLITPAPYAYYAFGAPSSGGSSPWSVLGSDVYYTGGEVGIGKTNPSYALDVTGTAIHTVYSRNTAPTGSAHAVTGHANSTGGTGVFGIASASSGTTYALSGEVYSPDGYGVYARNEGEGGNGYGIYGESWAPAGIGVHGYVTADVGDGTSKGVWGQVDSTVGRGVYGEATATTGYNYGVYGKTVSPTGVSVYGINTAGGIAVKGEATPTTGWAGYFYGRAYVSGNMGIGTTVPAAPLHVFGANNWDVANGEGDFKVGNSAYRIKMGVATGGVGAGSSRIYAAGGVNKLILGANQTDVVWVRDTNSGSVGIGTADPSTKLDVAGTIKMTGFQLGTSATAGHVLMADASGAGTWQTDSVTLPYSRTHATVTTAFQVANSTTGDGLRGESNGGEGVHGVSSGTGGSGVYGFCGTGRGVYGFSNAGIGVKAQSNGTTTANPALHVSNSNAAGIGILSTVTSTDANTVIANKGAGDLIKGFSGPTGNDLVFRVENDGTTTVSVLTITGGADLAERFDMTESVEPGTVVAIDPDHVGKLRVARGEYNRSVAGVVSGANGVEAGMILAELAGATNAVPVALTGRVWVQCDATNAAIAPGDLMTTADRPGHAMAATDLPRAQGAVIGKAMSALAKGTTGMVLVLVNLQ